MPSTIGGQPELPVEAAMVMQSLDSLGELYHAAQECSSNQNNGKGML